MVKTFLLTLHGIMGIMGVIVVIVILDVTYFRRTIQNGGNVATVTPYGNVVTGLR